MPHPQGRDNNKLGAISILKSVADILRVYSKTKG